jgi:uncharacterized protein YbgA (DUF1722 family)/uncharacterized protein YbbK (DUF523 family)
VKPIVVLSKCLEFAPCRYNGAMIPDRFVKQLQQHVVFLPVCPEVEIGLGVPRDPVRIVSKNGALYLLQPATGKDLSEKMRRFSNRFLTSLDEVDGFILKNRSPSCGIKDVKLFTKVDAEIPVGKGAGFFAGEVLERFPGLAIEDEGRLSHPKIRDHFLTKLFTFARFREAKKTNRLEALVHFHATHKLLLMAYSQKMMCLLGRIVGNSEKRPAADLFKEYAPSLQQTLARPSRSASNINVLMHTLGYFSDKLSKREKAFFLQTLESYQKGHLPRSTALSILKAWVVRFQNPYLENQIFFEPYPEALIETETKGQTKMK